jgi:predicted tellurium resistance membrane protein TerC
LELILAFLTLAFLEIVLGVDNIIFISILTNKLPEGDRRRARTLGLGLALFFRIAMLLSVTWIMQFTEPLFHVVQHPVSGRDLVLGFGGFFLLWKATKEIFSIMEHHHSHRQPEEGKAGDAKTRFAGIIFQIALLDIIFSFDSILTAIGMTQDIGVMIAAIVVSMAVMLRFSGAIARVIEVHPSLQILSLAFLILIGAFLIAEAAGQHVPKGYIYVAVGFSLGVELINIRGRVRQVPPPPASDADKPQA